MKIFCPKLLIRMNAVTTAPKLCWPWEADIYREKFGLGNVQLVGSVEKTIGRVTAEFIVAEFARCVKVFGQDAETNEVHAHVVYGRGKEALKAFKQAILDGKKEPVEPDDIDFLDDDDLEGLGIEDDDEPETPADDGKAEDADAKPDPKKDPKPDKEAKKDKDPLGGKGNDD